MSFAGDTILDFPNSQVSYQFAPFKLSSHFVAFDFNGFSLFSSKQVCGSMFNSPRCQNGTLNDVGALPLGGAAECLVAVRTYIALNITIAAEKCAMSNLHIHHCNIRDRPYLMITFQTAKSSTSVVK